MNTDGLTVALTVLAVAMLGHAAADSPGPSTRSIKLPDADSVVDYGGHIGEKLPTGLLLRFGKEQLKPTGAYFYYKCAIDIRIEAQIDGRTIHIQEFGKGGKQTGQFIGESATVDAKHSFHRQ
jgi:hypothetical protein